MSTLEIGLTCFAWGFVLGIIFYRGMQTGKWSFWP